MEVLSALCFNGIKLSTNGMERIRKYLSLLERWNRIHALTSVTPRDIPYVFAVEPILFAKEVEKFIRPAHVLDMGTGFGNPGVAMAVYFNQAKFVLVDSSVKKTALLRSAMDMCHIENVQVLTERVEKLASNFFNSFDLVVSRGVGDVKKVTDYAIPFVKKGGFIAIMKAKMNMSEFSNVDTNLKIEEILTVNVSYPNKRTHRYLALYRR